MNKFPLFTEEEKTAVIASLVKSHTEYSKIADLSEFYFNLINKMEHLFDALEKEQPK